MRTRARTHRWLVASLLLASSGLASAAPRPAAVATDRVIERPPSPSAIDWDAVRERTARFNRRREIENAIAAKELFSRRNLAVIQSLRACVGGPPSFLERLRFPGRLDGFEKAECAAPVGRLDAFLKGMDEDVRSARIWLTAIENGPDPVAGPLRDLLGRERLLVDSRAREVRSLVMSAREALGLQSGGFLSRTRLFWRQLVGRDAPTLMAELESRLRSWDVLHDPAVIGAELTYVKGGQEPGGFPSSSVTPAYLSAEAGTVSLALEDTTQGREVELTPEVQAKATELGSALDAYNFVKNELKLDWYFGSLKASGETLRERRGNDVDLAALLISILRAQGTPARYVQGTIELPIARLAELMGLLSAEEADALHGPTGLSLDSARRDQVLSALAATGTPVDPVVRGGQVTSVRFLHTWVEGYVAYANYRGAGLGGATSQWVAMDPAIPGSAKYVATPAAVDLLSGIETDAARLVADYLRQGAPGQSPLAFTRARAQAWLDTSGPAGVTYGQALRSVAQRREELPFIPGTLPYAVPAVHDEYAFLPESAKHRVHVTVQNTSGTVLFDATTPMHAVLGKRTVLAFEPATSADAFQVALAGGLYKVNAAAVSVVPVLRVAGDPVGKATGALGLGESAQWTIELLLPNGSSRAIRNDIVAGNLVAIGLGGPVNGYSDSADGVSGSDGEAARILYKAAADYANAWTAGENELADLLGVVPLRPTANLVLVENQLEVDQALGVRRRLLWKGLQVDADHRSMMPLELVPGRGRELLRLSGYEGSFQEARVLETATGEDAVSAVTLIQEAYRQGVPVLAITPTNAATVLQQLSTTPAVLREIQDQLARGREVTVPIADLTLRDWTGTGFIARSPATDEGGYYLSGLISGGQTIVSPGSWADQDLVQKLQAPTEREPENDTTLAARIVKASAPIQRGVVGKAQDVAVYVTTSDGRPVYRAPVTFTVLPKSQGTVAADATSTGGNEYRTVTDRSGLARATVRPDTVIAHESILEHGTPSDVLVGYNEIMAATDNGTNQIALSTPFVALTDHDAPSEIRLPDQINDSLYQAGLQIGQDLWAFVVDHYGNAIPNAVVTWSTSPVSGVYLDYAEMADRAPRVLDASDPAQFSSLGLPTSTEGSVETSFIPFPVARESAVALTASVSSLSASYHIRVRNPTDDADKYQFFVKRQHLWSDSGVFGVDFPEPIGGQVLHWTGDSQRLWVPLTGKEPGIQRVVVRMQVVDYTNPLAAVTLRTEEAEPRDTAFIMGAWASFDDDKTAAFWPRSDVDGGSQRNYLTYEVDRTGAPPIKPDTRWVIVSESHRPVVDRFRLLPGFEEKATDEFGSVSADDLAAVFHVKNPAGYPIYARVVAQPTIPAEALVVPPTPDSYARHPENPDLLEVPGTSTSDIRLAIVPGSHGGTVKLEVYVPKPQAGPTAVELLSYSGATIHISPPGAKLIGSDSPLVAQVIMPVRSFAATATPAAGKAYPDDADLPILRSAALDFRVKGQGRVTVKAGDAMVAAGDVVADGDGVLQGEPQPVQGFAALAVTPTRGIRAWVPPMNPSVTAVVVTFTPVAAGDVQTWSVPFTTVYKDMGPLPIGHTFVRDVDVVDGHLVKQAVDLSVPGRGAGFRFQRSYSSRSQEETPIGVGWTHSYISYATRDRSAGKDRYVVVGGEGTGQIFDCTAYVAGATGCNSQHGFHGRLDPSEGEVVYTALSGMKYRFGRLQERVDGNRWLLTEIVDPRGNKTTFVYGGGDVEGELVRVYEPGNRRALELTYDWPSGSLHPRLATVSLKAADGSPPDLAKELSRIDDPGVCVAFEYDVSHNLTATRRYDGACDPRKTPIREELYAYQDSPNEVLRNNLVAYTDPNVNTTTYAYYARTDRFEGEGLYLLMGDKEERIKSVTEPTPGGVTTFSYVMNTTPVAQFGTTQLLFRTIVSGPRPGVPPTTYYLDPYGASSRVERPVATRLMASSSTRWDPIHLRPLEEIDPRGRRTTFDYDDRGNLVSRVTYTPVLQDPTGKLNTEPLLDASGQLVDAVTEKWSFDPSWSAETCHLDAEGRLTTTQYIQGLPVSRRAYAAALGAQATRSSQSCDAIAAAAQTSDRDHITSFGYCGVNAACSASGSVPGDLVQTVEGPRLSTVKTYDIYGYARQTSARVSSAETLDSTTVRDARGRVTSESDSLGHLTTRRFDGLDRPVEIERVNQVGGSPGQFRALSYYPGGQPQSESIGTRASTGSQSTRTWSLNGLNKPAETTVSGKGLSSPVATTNAYDEAGNVVSVVDGRGVRRQATYDYADRPQSISITIDDRARFGAQGGDVAGFDLGDRVVATFEYDAAGNKVAETDLHGHRTTYGIDPLYRVVRVTQAGVHNDITARSEYDTLRRYDLVGNKVQEVDGDGHATQWTYDHENRVLETTDAVGRFDRKTYDSLGQVVLEESGSGTTVRLTRTFKGYDGLGRSLGLTEDFASLGPPAGAPTNPNTGSRYVTDVAYDDAQHTVATRDRRGYVTWQQLDDVDRVYAVVADASMSPLQRQPDPRVGAPLDLVTRYEYDPAGNRAAVVDAEGRRTQEDYDAFNRVTLRRLPMGYTEAVEYDADGRVIGKTDARGIHSRTTFDAAGRPTGEWIDDRLSTGTAELRLVTRTYQDNASNTRTTETDARVYTSTHYFDALHREYRTEKGPATLETWFDATQVRRTRDAKGYVTELDRDAVGRVAGQRDLDLDGSTAYQQHIEFDDASGTQTAYDRRGNPTLTVKDGLGRIERVSRGKTTWDDPGSDPSLVRTEATVFDGGGNAVVVVDPNGHATESVFDGAGRKVIETRAVGMAVAAATTFKHDRVGNVIETKGPRVTGKPFDVRLSYDDRNRGVRSEDALGNVTTSAFDGAGNKICEKLPLGGDPIGAGGASGRSAAEIEGLACGGDHVTRWSYDEASKLLSVQDAAGGEYTFVYDEARNLVAKQDANGNLTTYAYDVLDRRTDEWQHLDPHTRVHARTEVPRGDGERPADPVHETGSLHWHVSLDANGNPQSTTDPKGLVTTAQYGVLNRLGHVTYDRPLLVAYPLVRGVTYVYDGNGNRDLVTEEKETAAGVVVQEMTDPTYDSLDRLSTERRYDGKLLQYRYDAKGNRKEIIDPDTISTTYAYDALDRVQTATTPDGVTTYRYWPDGLEKGRSLPNGVEEGRCYDAVGRLTQLVTARGPVAADCSSTAQVVSQFAYAYDADGNRAAQLEQRTAPGAVAPRAVETTRYGYDALDRLVGVRYDDGQTVLYRLDPVGNRTGERELSGQPETIDLTSFTPADQGALLRDVTGTFNRADWLLAQTDATNAARNVTFGWDLVGNLVSRQRAGQSRELRWDGRNELVAVVENGTAVGTYDYDAAGIRVKRRTASEQVEYVLDDKYVLQEARGDVAGHPSYRRYHYAEGPLSVTDAAGSRFIGTDALGSTTDLTTSTGVVAATHQYDAWGQYRNGTEPSASDPKLGYTGHQYDPETGLVYARARYYDPEIGIFISRDPYEGELEDGPSLHRYAYALGNPLGYVDEDGNAAADVAEDWERWQREHAYTGEKIVEQAFRPNSEAILKWAAESGPRGKGFWAGAGRAGMGFLGVTGATLNDAAFGFTAGLMDPSMLVRGVMRIGAGAGEGSVDIQNGQVAEGLGKIAGDAGSAILAATGGYDIATAPMRAAASRARVAFAREEIVKTIREAKSEGPPLATFAENSPPPGAIQPAIAEQADTAPVTRGSTSAEALDRATNPSPEVQDLLQRAMADGEGRTPAAMANLADRAANEPGFAVAMDATRKDPLPQGTQPYQLELFPREIYDRDAHYGYTPTEAQRSLVPPGMEFDHVPPLVQHYYEGPGGGRLPGYNLTQAEREAFAARLDVGRAATPKQQRAQGGLAAYSKSMRKRWGLTK
jgi:RHS repeat-associated protein